MATGAYNRVAHTNSDFMYIHKTRRGLYLGSSAAMSVEITKCHYKLIRPHLVLYLEEGKYHKWLDGAYITVPPKLQ